MKKHLWLVGLFILVIILLKINISQLVDMLFHINISYLLLAVILNIPQLFFKSYRWNFLLKQQGINYSSLQSFRVYLSSVYIGVVTPGRIGEFVKTLYLKSDKGISLSKGFSSVLLDRLFDLYFLIIMGFLGIWQLDILGKFSDALLILSVAVLFTPLIMLNKHLVRKFTKILYKITVIKIDKRKLEESFDEFYSGISQLIDIRLLVSGLLTCMGYCIFFIQSYLLVLAMDLSINFITITLFMAISNLITFIPISISGLGTRDAILIYLFSLIGLKPELAVSFAFLVFFTFFVCGGLIGSIFWFFHPVDIKYTQI